MGYEQTMDTVHICARLRVEAMQLQDHRIGWAATTMEHAANRIQDLESVLHDLHKLTKADDPVTVGCHCTSTDEGEVQCVWCRAKDLLAKHM